MSSKSFSYPRVRYEDIQDEVNNMSEEKQNSARRDLYGQQPPIHETDDMLINAFLQIDVEIDKIPSKIGYETAQLKCPDYVGSVEFLRMFLRAERFDVARAAQRIVDYWDHKVEVFGEEKAFRGPISLDDFDKEDQVALESGGIHLLPRKDNAGRGVCASHRELWDQSHPKSMIRLFWYIIHTAAEDQDVQRNGMIMFCTNSLPWDENDETYDVKLDRQLATYFKDVLPVRLVAVHTIIANPAVKLAIEGMLFAAGPELRARHKQYDGTTEQNLIALASYGIQPYMIPPKLGGTLDYDYGEWLRNRREQGR